MVARRFSGADEKALVRLYREGMTQEALASHFNTSAITVRSSLRRAGVTKIRGPGGPLRRFSKEEIKRIISLYQSGQSQERIAQVLRTAQPKVSVILRREGIVSKRGAKHGQHHPLWKGKTITSHGYVLVKADIEDALAVSMTNGAFYVMEHRLVMARSLGRPLIKSETVHHINGDKSDNRVENLQLRSAKHGNGQVARCADCGSCNIAFVKIAEC